ncbi:MAG: hypothetical protein E6Q24_13785 [Chitinophagaceae bacterium]|nr:MAG: hypothetical protein E6Q24_13785 [Chitinophagaceae bacterium]
MKRQLQLLIQLFIVTLSSPGFLYAQNVFPTPNGNVGIGTNTPETPLHVVGESRFNGLGWFSRNNNGTLTTALQLGQNKDWNFPVVTISTSDVGGANHVFWRASRYSHTVTFERESSSGPKQMVRMGGYDGGSHFLSVYGIDGETVKAQLSGENANYFLNDMGIGANTPLAKLHIADGAGGEQLRISRGTGAVRFTQYPNENNLFLYNKDASKLYMSWRENGNVGIGTIDPQAKLAVNGDIFAKKIKVTQTGWPDYVFDSAYQLLPLVAVEKFVNQHKHLPEVPSADFIGRNGLDVGESQAVLLKKIEELTLYIIQQQKELETLKKLSVSIDELKQEIKVLKEKRTE